MNTMESKDILRAAPLFPDLRIALLVPCYNEEAAIGAVIDDFRAALPDAMIYVYDNNSTDRTAEIARAKGAIVRTEHRQGKGNVVRRMFADIDADVYLMVDGDSTYDATAAPRLIERLLEGPYDQVNGIRITQVKKAYRPGHRFGNMLFTKLVGQYFGNRSKDMLSGYKALSRRFVKSFPAGSQGFEIETELLIHALDMDVPMSEVETAYFERPENSQSKLSTFRDGFRILMLIIYLIRDLRPLRFFGVLAGLLAIAGLALGISVLIEFLSTGLVPRLPTAILALGIELMAIIAFFAGLILDGVARARLDQKRLQYLRYPPVGGSGRD